MYTVNKKIKIKYIAKGKESLKLNLFEPLGTRLRKSFWIKKKILLQCLSGDFSKCARVAGSYIHIPTHLSDWNRLLYTTTTSLQQNYGRQQLNTQKYSSIFHRQKIFFIQKNGKHNAQKYGRQQHISIQKYGTDITVTYSIKNNSWSLFFLSRFSKFFFYYLWTI